MLTLMWRSDTGAAEGISLLIVTPVLIALIMFLVAATRLSLAGNAVEAAASSASRAATLQRSTTNGITTAHGIVAEAMAASGFRCTTFNATVDSSRATQVLGVIGAMDVTVNCTVPLSDLTLLPLPGSMTLTRTASSPTSAYMERTN